MGSKKTPLLQKLRSVGGTLYVFPSASEDIGLNLQSTTTGVAMSHFALLNIPKIKISDCSTWCSHSIEMRDGNEALAMSLQNYAMNFETYLTNRDDYNYQKLETISEKIFWKWADHIGIIDCSNNISNVSTGNENIYIENAYNADGNVSTQDNTVIKCFGSIDAGNQLSTEFGMFNETYINIPTSWGAGPVFLKHSDSDNFKLGSSYTIVEHNHLENRGDSNEYYSYTRGQDYPFFDTKSRDLDGVYDTYVIDDVHNGFEILKDIDQIQYSSRVKFNNDEILFDSYDDINIDTLNQLNIDQEFEFNTILLYYSVYDQDDIVKTAYATNLFGVIFLDGTQMLSNGDDASFVIPTIKKRKSTTTQFGNSYSFRVNLKTMSVYDNTDAIIQDNTTMSSVSAVEFSDAISNMNRAIDIMNSNLTTTLAIQDQYAAIINYYDNFEDDLRDISTCLNAYLKGTRSSFIDTSVAFVNEIRSSESENSEDDNQILIRTHTQNKNELGEYIYNEPVVTIKDTNVMIPDLTNKKLTNVKSYIQIDDINADFDASVSGPFNNENYFVQECIDTIDKAFSDEGFNIKLKIKNSTYNGEYSENELYIDPESPIFTKSDNYNLRCLLDPSNNNNINYAQIIPYLIAEVKELKRIINEMQSNN